MIESRSKQILDYLTKDYKFHSLGELNYYLKLSFRTIREEIDALNSYIENNGAIIQYQTGKGYIFQIKDESEFKKFLKDEWYKYAYYNQDDNKGSRIQNILKLLIFSNSYIKQQELAEMFFVSTSQINKDMKTVRDILKSYNLNLKSKPYYGMKIIGDEKDIRMCIRNEIGEDPDIYDLDNYPNLVKEIKNIVSSFDFGSSYYMPYVVSNNLVFHIYIAILRIKQNRIISISDDIKEKISKEFEFKIAKKLIQELSLKLNIVFPYEELIYLTMHLVTKNKIIEKEKISSTASEISQEMIDRIYEISKYDFRSNIDLYLSLSMHIGPLIERINYGFNMKNPILEDIKKNKLSFLLATVAASVINDKYKIKISDDEIGFIALHIMTAIENNNINNRDILIVCGSGNASSSIMKSQIEKKFSNKINNIDVTDIQSINEYDLDHYDFIISSIDYKFDTKTKVVYVDIIFKKSDISNIDNALDDKALREIIQIFNNSIFLKCKEVKSKDQILDIIAKLASEKCSFNEKFIKKELIKRENLSNTSYDYKVAIPHILKQVDCRTFSIILILNNQIDWGRKNVKLVYSLFVGNERGNMNLYYQKLGDFLNSEDKIKKALKSKDIKGFSEIFIDL